MKVASHSVTAAASGSSASSVRECPKARQCGEWQQHIGRRDRRCGHHIPPGMAERGPRHHRQDHQRQCAGALQMRPVHRPCRPSEQRDLFGRQHQGWPAAAGQPACHVRPWPADAARQARHHRGSAGRAWRPLDAMPADESRRPASAQAPESGFRPVSMPGGAGERGCRISVLASTLSMSTRSAMTCTAPARLSSDGPADMGSSGTSVTMIRPLRVACPSCRPRRG